MWLLLIVGLVVLVCSACIVRVSETVALKGQTKQQLETDRSECLKVAVKVGSAERLETGNQDAIQPAYMDCMYDRGYQVMRPKE